MKRCIGKVAVMRGLGQIAPVINLPTIGQVATRPEDLPSGSYLIACTFNSTSFDHCGNLTATSWHGAYFWAQDRFANGFNTFKRGDNNSANNPADNELGYNSFYGWDGSAYGRGGYFIVRAAQPFTTSNHGSRFAIAITPSGSVSSSEVLNINEFLNVGIGTNAPGAKLEVQGTSGDLLRLTNPNAGGAVFKVDAYGTVYADGSYNCGYSSGCFNAGQGADVAERIDASEKLEAGDVVEIDPEHAGLFRKVRTVNSTLVAGVISTAPAVTLANAFDAGKDHWKDERPLLALTGRVPVKVTNENGPIQAGDLLISSSTPGYAMRCAKRDDCVGAIIGKALEPLKAGTGKILVLVVLR